MNKTIFIDISLGPLARESSCTLTFALQRRLFPLKIDYFYFFFFFSFLNHFPQYGFKVFFFFKGNYFLLAKLLILLSTSEQLLQLFLNHLFSSLHENRDYDFRTSQKQFSNMFVGSCYFSYNNLFLLSTQNLTNNRSKPQNISRYALIQWAPGTAHLSSCGSGKESSSKSQDKEGVEL